VELGLRRSSNDAELLGNSAWLLGTLGKWDLALAAAEAANKVDPRSLDGLKAHARLLVYLHRYDDLLALCQRGLALAPRYSHFVAWKMIASLMQGDSLGARAAFSEGSPALDTSTLTSALANLFQDLLPWVMSPAAQNLLTTGPAPSDPTDRISWWTARSSLVSWRNDATRARVYADSAVAAFDTAFPAASRDALLHAWRAQLLGYAKRAPEAKEELKLEQTSRGHPDAFFDPVRDQARALALIQLGEHDAALDILSDLVDKPYWLTKDWLRIAPEYRPLRGNPRFESLVAGRRQR
jgi:tetratricopeptide (TPR) repeat protein